MNGSALSIAMILLASATAQALLPRLAAGLRVSVEGVCTGGREKCDSTAPAWGLSRWRPEFLRAVSLGQLPTVVDGLWVEAISDESLARLGSGVRPRLFHVFDVLTDLDPAFFESYVLAGSLLAVIRDDPAGARFILEKAERFRTSVLPEAPPELLQGAWKNRWRIPFQLGFIALFEENDLLAAEKHFRTAGELPGAPLHFQRLGERFGRPEGKYEVGLNLVTLELRRENLREDERIELEVRRNSLLVRLEATIVDSQFQQWRLKAGLRPDESSFRRWLREVPGARRNDSFGGEFRVLADGRIDSTTPRVPVFGIP